MDALARASVRDAVQAAPSWRAAARALDLRSSRDLVALRVRCAEEGVSTAHLPGVEADARFAQEVARASDWAGLLAALGHAPGSGSARATVRGRARRLGLPLDHLEPNVETTGALAQAVGHRRPDLLRTAAPALLAAELLQRGCAVSWPLEPVAYDLLVELPRRQRLLRVQVKSGSVRQGAAWLIRLSRTGRGSGGAYCAEEVDAFGLVDGDRQPYLVPAQVLEGRTTAWTATLQHYRLLA